MTISPFPCYRMFNPNDGTWLSVVDYGAVGDGVEIDTAAIQDCMDAAVAAGKGVYVPPGTYRCVTLEPPDGTVMRGAGATSILQNTSDASAGGNVLYCIDASNLSFSYMRMQGINTGKLGGGDSLIRLGNSHYITIDHMSFNSAYFAIRSGSDGSVVGSSNVTVTNCEMLSNQHTGLFLAYMDDFIMRDCILDSYMLDDPGTSHQMYLAAYLDTLLFERCTLKNGSNYALQIYDGPSIVGLTFNDLVFDDVKAACIIGPASSDGITFNRPYGRSTRFDDDSWFAIYSGAANVLVDDFDLDGADAYGIATSSGNTTGEVVFSNGVMTNCGATYYGYTPAGFKTVSGDAITSTNNTVST